MTKQAENLILEHLRAIRTTQEDNGERLGRIELRLSAIEQMLAISMPCLAVAARRWPA